MRGDAVLVGETRPKLTLSSDPGLRNAALITDQRFGRYTLVAKIGHGGMAEVFLAANRGPAGFTKLAVLKRLHPHLEDEPSLVGMFLDEARLAARLNHPNVVQTFDVGDVEGLHYLAMEYLEGQSLARVLRHAQRTGEPLPLSVGCRIFMEALDGLSYAHLLKDYDGTPLNVVHRDISPGNLFLTYDGQVKVLDFGIAKAGTQLTETRAGQVKGKFAYIAPEQARPGAHDHRADLWSLGVVMWEAFSGKRLFKGESEVSTLHNALSSEILSLDSASQEIPSELSQVVDRALQRDPDKRYGSAQQMREDLGAFMTSAGLRASRSDVGAFVTSLFERERDEQRRILQAYMAGELEGQLLTPLPDATSPSHSGVVSQAPSERSPGRGAAALVFILAVALGGLGALSLRSSGEGVAPPSSGSAAGGDAPRPTHSEEAEPSGQGRGQGAAVVAAPGQEDRHAAEAAATEAAATEATAAEATAAEVIRAAAAAAEAEARAVAEAQAAAEAEAEAAAAAEAENRRRRPPRRRAPPVMQEEATPQGEEGFLTLDSSPWSEVKLGPRSLGVTPIRRVALPEGTHVLTLVNPERGLRTRYEVTIRAGQTTTRRVGLQ